MCSGLMKSCTITFSILCIQLFSLTAHSRTRTILTFSQLHFKNATFMLSRQLREHHATIGLMNCIVDSVINQFHNEPLQSFRTSVDQTFAAEFPINTFNKCILSRLYHFFKITLLSALTFSSFSTRVQLSLLLSSSKSFIRLASLTSIPAYLLHQL